MKKRILFQMIGLAMFIPMISFSQNSIKGIVKSSDGNTIPGVKVEIEASFNKVFTNVEGEYIFTKLKDGEYQLLFSMTGFTLLLDFNN